MKWAIVLCYFRHKSPTGPAVDSDDEHDDRDQHNLDDLPELVNINQHDWWLPAQSPPPLPPGPLTPLQQPVTPLPISQPPPPPPPQPTQSITIDEVFANFCSVLNL
jgi:hypothetical protein